MGEKFVNHRLDKGLIFRIYIRNSQNSVKTYNLIKRWAKDLNRNFIKENTQMINEKNDEPDQSLRKLGKANPKQDSTAYVLEWQKRTRKY